MTPDAATLHPKVLAMYRNFDFKWWQDCFSVSVNGIGGDQIDAIDLDKLKELLASGVLPPNHLISVYPVERREGYGDKEIVYYGRSETWHLSDVIAELQRRHDAPDDVTDDTAEDTAEDVIEDATEDITKLHSQVLAAYPNFHLTWWQSSLRPGAMDNDGFPYSNMDLDKLKGLVAHGVLPPDHPVTVLPVERGIEGGYGCRDEEVSLYGMPETWHLSDVIAEIQRRTEDAPCEK